MTTLSTTRPNHLVWGYLIGALGAALFATKGIVIKLALLEHIGPVTTLTWRMIIAVPFFAVIGWMGWRSRLKRNPDFSVPLPLVLRAMAVGSLGYYAASYLDFSGLRYITAQLDRLILMTYPIFVVIIGALMDRKPLSRGTMAALLLSYFGLALIFWRDISLTGPDVVLGSVLVLGAALTYALYQILAKPLIDVMGGRLFTSIAMSAAGIVVVAQFALTRSLSDLILPPYPMALMLAIGTISTVLPAYLIAIGIGMIGPGPTAVIGNISPLVTIALAVTVLGETFTPWHALGAATTLTGVFIFTRLRAPVPPPVAPES